MNNQNRAILENIFDSLDRLFDQETGVIDLCALLFASDMALGAEFDHLSLSVIVSRLQSIIKSEDSESIQREKALEVTDSLRLKLNEILPS